MKRIVSSKHGSICAIFIFLFSLLVSSHASALQNITVNVSATTGCQSTVSPASVSIFAGTDISLVVNNGDWLVGQFVNAGNAGTSTLYSGLQAKKGNGNNVITVPLGTINGNDTILFTPFASSDTDPANETTNFCLLKNHPIPVPSSLSIVTLPMPAPTKPTTNTVTSQSTPQAKTATPITPTPTVKPTPPTAPLFGSALIEGKSVNIAKPIEFKSNESFQLFGQTVPSAKVTLVIHSTPKTVTFSSNSDGSWSYTISNLTPGSHYILASVTDPSTKLSSPPTKIASFKVDAAIIKTAPKPSSKASAYVIGALVLLVVVAVIIVKRSKRSSQAIDATPTLTSSSEPIIISPVEDQNSELSPVAIENSSEIVEPIALPEPTPEPEPKKVIKQQAKKQPKKKTSKKKASTKSKKTTKKKIVIKTVK